MNAHNVEPRAVLERAVCFLLRCQRKRPTHVELLFWVWKRIIRRRKNFFPKIFFLQNVQKEMATFCGFLVASFMDKRPAATSMVKQRSRDCRIRPHWLVTVSWFLWRGKYDLKNNYLLRFFFSGQVIYDWPVATRTRCTGHRFCLNGHYYYNYFHFPVCRTPLIQGEGDTATAAVPKIKAAKLVEMLRYSVETNQSVSSVVHCIRFQLASPPPPLFTEGRSRLISTPFPFVRLLEHL